MKKRAGVEGREEQWDSFKTGKNTLRHAEKKKSKLLCATSPYSGGAKLHSQQQFYLFLHAPHFCIIRENNTLSCCIKDNHLLLFYGSIVNPVTVLDICTATGCYCLETEILCLHLKKTLSIQMLTLIAGHSVRNSLAKFKESCGQPFD